MSFPQDPELGQFKLASIYFQFDHLNLKLLHFYRLILQVYRLKFHDLEILNFYR